jgi:hypothetical protein
MTGMPVANQEAGCEMMFEAFVGRSTEYSAGGMENEHREAGYRANAGTLRVTSYEQNGWE